MRNPVIRAWEFARAWLTKHKHALRACRKNEAESCMGSSQPTMEPFGRIEEIFHGALQRDASQRGEFVHQACGSDSAMRREVLSLLANYEGSPARNFGRRRQPRN
jgi:hypothetical protein